MSAQEKEKVAVDAALEALALAGAEVDRPVVAATKTIRFGGRRCPLFVVEARAPDDTRRYAAAGAFTQVLPIEGASVDRIPKAKRIRRLINVAVGGWLVDQAAEAWWSAADVASAYRRRTSTYLVRNTATEEGALPGGVLSTSLSTSRMRLEIDDVVGVWIEDHAYAAADVRLRVSLGKGEVVHVRGPHWLRWTRDGELLDLLAADARHLTFPEAALAHVVGTAFGPTEILNKWGSATLVD
jgi:hypothetical protein